MHQEIKEWLKAIIHPELKQNITDAGLINKIEINEKQIRVVLLYKKPVDPFANTIKRNAEELLKLKIKNKEIIVENLFPEVKTKKYEGLTAVKNIVAIASGKGGVGKSTLTANIAVALAMNGYKVGLLDGDVYGPSIPKMFGIENEKPEVTVEEGIELIKPIEKYGVKVLSIGFFVDPNQALIWRGSMATSALKQLLEQTEWGELDVLLIDMPPGTGDIHLTLVQTVAVTGVAIVTTPQEVAIADVIKGISMFRNPSINVPVLGIIENMSWFTPAELPENKYYIFGKGGGERMAKQFNVPLLGQIPLVQSICESGDKGKPIVNAHSIEAEAFRTLCNNLLTSLEERNKMEPTKKVEITHK
ncbi:MAG TPA: Mrp/NBP35 family ATP-binding protein [Bacteroidales bacterium]|nr:Mrp/NBP35 family ATP-binding protein [Bacteroidales bacterium]